MRKTTAAMMVSMLAASPIAMANEGMIESDLSTRLPQPKDRGPYATTVIDLETIRMSGAMTVGEVMRLIPGMLVGYRDGAHEIIAYQGMTDEYARRMQVLVNGRSILLPSSGGVPWMAMPVQIDDIERIEVIHGPNSAYHGSNAFLGTIDIITRHPRETEKAMLSVGHSDHGSTQTTARASYTGDMTAASFSLHDMRSDGYTDRSQITPFADAYRSTGGVVRIDTNLDRTSRGTGQVTLEAGANTMTTEIGGYAAPWDAKPGRNEAYRDEAIRHNFQNLAWHTGSNDLYAVVRLGRMEDHLEDLSTLTMAPGISVRDNNGYASARYDAEVEVGGTLAEHLRGQVGASLRKDEITSEGLLGANSPATVDLSRAFGQIEWRPLERWTFHVMGAVERTTIMDAHFTPTVAANYALGGGHHLRVGYAEGIRHPMAYEELADNRLNLPGVGAMHLVESMGGLRPELNRTLDASWLFRKGKHYESQLRFFRSELTELITPYERSYSGLTLIPGVVMDFKNADSLIVRGVELSHGLKRDGWLVRVAYAHTTVENANACAADLVTACGMYPTSVPKHNATLLAGYKFNDGWEASALYQYVSEYRWMWLTYPVVGDYQRLNLRLAKRIHIDDQMVIMEVLGKSLIGHVHDFRADAAWGKEVMLRLSWRM